MKTTAGLVLCAARAHAAEPARTAPSHAWQASVHGRWFPGYGDVKGNVPDDSTPQAEGGYGLRLDHWLDERWRVGLSLSSASWSVESRSDPGVLLAGSFLDASVRLTAVPLRFDVPGGPLDVYLAAFGGPTLSGEIQATQSAASARTPAQADNVRFDAGYNAGGALGASYHPFERFSLFIEAGLDWHYAVHARRAIDTELQLLSDLPPAVVERLWFGQGEVALGAAYHF